MLAPSSWLDVIASSISLSSSIAVSHLRARDDFADRDLTACPAVDQVHHLRMPDRACNNRIDARRSVSGKLVPDVAPGGDSQPPLLRREARWRSRLPCVPKCRYRRQSAGCHDVRIAVRRSSPFAVALAIRNPSTVVMRWLQLRTPGASFLLIAASLAPLGPWLLKLASVSRRLVAWLEERRDRR